MEIGSVRTPVTGVTQPVPKAPAESEQSVRTDNPVRAAVSEAAKSESQSLLGESASSDDASSTKNAVDVALNKGGNRRKAPAEQRQVERDFELDPQTRSLVYKKIDVQSGDVVEQVPEESLLRMRQMIQAWGDGGAAGTKTGRSAAYDVTA